MRKLLIALFCSYIASASFAICFGEENIPEEHLCEQYKSGQATAGRYTSQIRRCLDPNAHVSPEEYLCENDTSAQVNDTVQQERAYQVVVDLAFRDIDRDVEGGIIQKDGSSLDRILKLPRLDMFGIFQRRYTAVCNCIAKYEVLSYFKPTDGLSSKDGTEWFTQDAQLCEQLAQKKLEAYKDAGMLIVAQDTVNDYKTGTRDFMEKVNEKMQELSFLFQILVKSWSEIEGKVSKCVSQVIGG